ncbi:cupin domain-containing protein [Streptomyces nojiriensis]|uniref:cupin domain-containing protein n=1 Tax=Streptomyces nojiriensis TaxID=66374 RepID=UPI002E17E707
MYPEWVKNLPQIDTPFPGAFGRLMSSAHGQVVLWEFANGATVPPHRHGPQMGIVLSGRTVMTIEGETREWLAGEFFSIGDQEEHSAIVDPGTYIIEIFEEPDRHKAND